MFWKSKRVKQLEELVGLLKAQLEAHRKPPENIYTLVQIPQPTDHQTFHTHIANLTDDPFYLFYFTQLRRKTTDNFETHGKDNAEFYRGRLAAIGDIFLDARQSKAILTTAKPEQEAKRE
jgi:hypothetical protein